MHHGRLVQRDDRRVRQARGRERLPRGTLAVAVGAERDTLDRDLAMQELVVRAPDDAEAAGAETFEQAVAIEHDLLDSGGRFRAELRGRAREQAARPRRGDARLARLVFVLVD